MLRVAKVIEQTSAEGPFERCAIWVAGCDLGCPGCCNPHLFDGDAGLPVGDAELGAILRRVRSRGTEGITVLGGEPLQQLDDVAWVLEHAQRLGLGTIVYSGYSFAEARHLPSFERAWSAIDTLVDGRFDAGRIDRTRRFIGSSNQRLHHRTDRYANPALWSGPTRIEATVGHDGTVEVHGMPKAVARIAAALRQRS